MARVVTVNDVLDGHVTLDIECLDRIYLNAYVPILQTSSQVVAFLSGHLGFPFASPALLPGAEKSDVGGVHAADEKPDIPGGVVGQVPVHVGEVPDLRLVSGGDCCLRAGESPDWRGG